MTDRSDEIREKGERASKLIQMGKYDGAIIVYKDVLVNLYFVLDCCDDFDEVTNYLAFLDQAYSSIINVIKKPEVFLDIINMVIQDIGEDSYYYADLLFYKVKVLKVMNKLDDLKNVTKQFVERLDKEIGENSSSIDKYLNKAYYLILMYWYDEALNVLETAESIAVYDDETD